MFLTAYDGDHGEGVIICRAYRAIIEWGDVKEAAHFSEGFHRSQSGESITDKFLQEKW